LRQEHEAVDRAVARLEAEYAENLPPFILSTQATDVLDLLRKGTSNVKIAEQLSISKGVLQSHINAILNCPEVRDRARFGRRSDGSDGDESSKGQLNLGTIFSIKNTSHIEEYFVMDLDPVDCDIFFRIF
jgi:DNA-binding CsgD family transcriptional regulator